MVYKERKLKTDKNEREDGNSDSFTNASNGIQHDSHTKDERHDQQAAQVDIRGNLSHPMKSRKMFHGAYTKWRKRQQSSWFKICANSLLTKLPQLKNCPENERENLLIQKIRQCCVVFDFVSDPPSYEKLKDTKRITLNELVEYVLMFQNILTESVHAELFSMFAVNLFRPLPPSKRKQIGFCETEEEDIIFEPAWPHLQLVYELFREFLDSPDFLPDVAKKHITFTFINRFLQLFDSEDSRERECLTVILQKIYSKFIGLRPFIRKGMNNIFIAFIYENECHNGISELLDIVRHNINGYIVPLREENKTFLFRVLLPLHKAPSMNNYFKKLLHCILLFSKKDPSLAEEIVKFLLRYWPKTNSRKEALFLDEVLALLNTIPTPELRKCVKLVRNQIEKCCSSPNSNISERAAMIKHFIIITLNEI